MCIYIINSDKSPLYFFYCKLKLIMDLLKLSVRPYIIYALNPRISSQRNKDAVGL